MKLLSGLSQLLPNVILIEIAVIVVVGSILLALLTWKFFRRWWKNEPTIDEFNLYQDLPSAEAFLDDWTMTKPARMESDSKNIPPSHSREWLGHSHESGNPEISNWIHVSTGMTGSYSEKGQRPNEVLPGEEIDGVLKTIIQVKRDLKQKNEEIKILSNRLTKQQTANKFAIKEKLMAMRSAELNKRVLEQEVRDIEAKSFLEAKEKMELVSKLVINEKILAERKTELEMKALETEMQNLEEERNRAYEESKEKELRAFSFAKRSAEKQERVNFKFRQKIISKFKLVFNFRNFRGISSHQKREISYVPSAWNNEVRRNDLNISPPKDGRKTISVTIPPELMSG